MSKYTVEVPYLVWVTIKDIEADDKDHAEELAYDATYIDAYCGNGGIDKLIGVRHENMSIDPCEEPSDWIEGINIKVEEQGGDNNDS